MIEWLRRNPADPVIELLGRTLPIELRRDGRARRLTLRLARDGSAVRVTMPRWAPTADAIAFAHDRAEWLARELAKVPQRCAPGPGGTVLLRGERWTIDWAAEYPRRARPDAKALAVRIGGPADRLTTRLQRWLETETTALVASDLAFFAPRAGVPVPQLKLSRAEARWGSCTGKGVVRINWRLVQAPDFVRRSVVAHEVAHLVHFDHSPAFHALVTRIYDGEIGEADGWLREHGRSLYTAFG